MKTQKQVLAILLSGSLIGTSAPFAAAVQPLPGVQVNLPSSLGYISDSFNFETAAPTSKRVILIQDLHAHYGVQKNIAAILEFLSARLSNGFRGSKLPAPRSAGGVEDRLTTAGMTKGVPPFVLAVEGASGALDNSVMALFPDRKIKQSAMDYLMREGELTGAEYFAAMRGVPKLLNGVEDAEFYSLHLELVRQTWQNRSRLVASLQTIQSDLQQIQAQVYSRPLRRVQAKQNAFESGKLDLREYGAYLSSEAESLGVDTPDLDTALAAPSDQSLQVLETLGYQIKLQKARSAAEKDLVQVDHDLTLLLKVANLQATERDIKSFGPRLNSFIALCQSLLKTNGIKSFDAAAIRELMSSSINYYALALARNEPMVENTLALLGQRDRKPQTSNLKNKKTSRVLRFEVADLRSEVRDQPGVAVLIAGGFHTRELTQLLRERHVPYAVITPVVDEAGAADSSLYLKRLRGEQLSENDVLAAAPRWPASPTQMAQSEAGQNSALGLLGLTSVGLFLTVTLVSYASGADPSAQLGGFIQTHLNSLLAYPGVSDWIQHIPTALASTAGTVQMASVLAAPGRSKVPNVSKSGVTRRGFLKAAAGAAAGLGVAPRAVMTAKSDASPDKLKRLDWKKFEDIKKPTSGDLDQFKKMVLEFLARESPEIRDGKWDFEILFGDEKSEPTGFGRLHYPTRLGFGDVKGSDGTPPTFTMNINTDYFFKPEHPERFDVGNPERIFGAELYRAQIALNGEDEIRDAILDKIKAAEGGDAWTPAMTSTVKATVNAALKFQIEADALNAGVRNFEQKYEKLGQITALAVQNTMRYFRNAYEAALREVPDNTAPDRSKKGGNPRKALQKLFSVPTRGGPPQFPPDLLKISAPGASGLVAMAAGLGLGPLPGDTRNLADLKRVLIAELPRVTQVPLDAITLFNLEPISARVGDVPLHVWVYQTAGTPNLRVIAATANFRIWRKLNVNLLNVTSTALDPQTGEVTTPLNLEALITQLTPLGIQVTQDLQGNFLKGEPVNRKIPPSALEISFLPGTSYLTAAAIATENRLNVPALRTLINWLGSDRLELIAWATHLSDDVSPRRTLSTDDAKILLQTAVTNYNATLDGAQPELGEPIRERWVPGADERGAGSRTIGSVGAVEGRLEALTNRLNAHGEGNWVNAVLAIIGSGAILWGIFTGLELLMRRTANTPAGMPALYALLAGAGASLLAYLLDRNSPRSHNEKGFSQTQMLIGVVGLGLVGLGASVILVSGTITLAPAAAVAAGVALLLVPLVSVVRDRWQARRHSKAVIADVVTPTAEVVRRADAEHPQAVAADLKDSALTGLVARIRNPFASQRVVKVLSRKQLAVLYNA